MNKGKLVIRHFFLPYLKLNKFSTKNYYKKLPKNSIIFGRFENDFQSSCFLYKVGKVNSISGKDIKFLKHQGFKLCYSYEMFDFENREFTIRGYRKIRFDIDTIISSGFDYICVSNPYIIEIICNEYGRKINLVVSANLEINSPRGKLFFEVINDTSSLSHLIVSQNHLNSFKLREIIRSFKGVNIVLEIDRLASNNQIVHEHYYNVLYGYYNKGVKKYLRNFINGNLRYLKTPSELIYTEPGLSYKIGEIIVNSSLILKNLNAFLTKRFEDIVLIDLIWTKNGRKNI